MEDKRFRLLVQCCRALKMRKEATMVAMSYLETEKEIMTMLHLIKEHYRENLSEDRIIQIAQDIHKAMVSEKIYFCKTTKEDLYEIVTNIAVSYNSYETSLRNRLQELGIKSGNLPGVDFAAAIREGNRDNGLALAKAEEEGIKFSKTQVILLAEKIKEKSSSL